MTATAQGRRLPAWVIVLGLVVALIGVLMVLLLSRPPEKSLENAMAPDFTLPLFQGYEAGSSGGALKLSDLRGKGVVLNFWASWCKPCEEEAADLEAASREFKDKGIVFIGVDYFDQEPAALRYLEKFKITYANGPDLEGRVSKPYTIRGVPETFFIGPDGQIAGRRQVGPISPAELRKRIAQIMPK